MGLYRHYDETGETAITGVSYGLIKAGRVIDRAGTAQGGGSSTITLDAGAPSAADSFTGCYVAITSGTGSGQIRAVSSYNGTSKVLTVGSSWSVTPDATSVFRVFLARRYAVQNVGPAALSGVVASLVASGDNDGVQFPRWALDAVALSCPFNVAAAVAAGSGVFAGTGVVYYRLTGVKGSGETTGSVEVSATISATTDEVTLTWDALPGSPDNIKVYRSDTQGVYTTPALRATVSGGATSYVDDGDTLSSGAPPSANATGGASAVPYGVPPTLNSAADLSIGTFARGQQVFYWEEPLVIAGTPSGVRAWARRFEEA
jgi:hypothetical protein